MEKTGIPTISRRFSTIFFKKRQKLHDREFKTLRFLGTVSISRRPNRGVNSSPSYLTIYRFVSNDLCDVRKRTTGAFKRRKKHPKRIGRSRATMQSTSGIQRWASLFLKKRARQGPAVTITDFSDEIVTSTDFNHRVYEFSILFDLFSGKSFRFDTIFDSIRFFETLSIRFNSIFDCLHFLWIVRPMIILNRRFDFHGLTSGTRINNTGG